MWTGDKPIDSGYMHFLSLVLDLQALTHPLLTLRVGVLHL